MASVHKRPNGTREVAVMVPDETGRKRRRTIRLGKVNKHKADGIRTHIEHLASDLASGQPTNPDTAAWLGRIGNELHARLAAAGLCEPRPKPDEAQRAALGAFLDDYVMRRQDVAGATRTVWGHTVRNLKDFFGDGRKFESVTEGDAEDFKLYLIAQKLAETTISKRLTFARQFFDMARKRRLIPSNPFQDVKAAAPKTTERQRFITQETTASILEACNPVWRLIVSLARYGGLRCPSEVLMLRWEGVNWATGRITVDSPKGKRHGKAQRVIPMFPELRAELQEAWERSGKKAVYVVDADHYRAAAQGPDGWKNANLRTQFERILTRAGVAAWPRLFHNLRASRETELVAEYPVHVVCEWLGNTPAVAAKHYLQVTDADFERAADKKPQEITDGAEGASEARQNARHFCSEARQNARQPLSADIGPNKTRPTQTHTREAFRHTLADCDQLRPESSVERRRFELPTS